MPASVARGRTLCNARLGNRQTIRSIIVQTIHHAVEQRLAHQFLDVAHPFKNFELLSQLAAEYFSTLNYSNFSDPTVSFRSESFDPILSTANAPRIGQPALNLLF